MDKLLRYNTFLVSVCCVIICCNPSRIPGNKATDPLAQLSNPPDAVPQVFAKGIISMETIREGAITFSPDMKEIYYTSTDSTGNPRVMFVSYTDKGWTRTRQWEHSNAGKNHEPFISPDGNTLYFISNRHAPDVKGSGRIYLSSRSKGNWKTPKMLDFTIETGMGIWFPATSNGATLYFGAYLDSIGNFGKSDLYSYSIQDRLISNLGPEINSPDEEWDPFIAPDESYMLFESDRPGGFGATDIYICFKKEGGGWSQPVNLGPTINTKDYEVAAKVSPDGKYLFFDRPKKTDQDIWWVTAGVITKMKAELR